MSRFTIKNVKISINGQKESIKILICLSLKIFWQKIQITDNKYICAKGEKNINKKTSVIITTYNDAEFLKRLIPSVLNQSLKPLEVIIIDDGSFDDYAEKIISSYRDNTEIPIKFLKKENGGPSSARNSGIKLAIGEFIIFIDADDELLPDSIEWRQKKLESFKDAEGVEWSGYEYIGIKK